MPDSCPRFGTISVSRRVEKSHLCEGQASRMRPLASQRSLAMLIVCVQTAGMKKAFPEGSAVWTRTPDDNFAAGCVASAADGWTVVRLVGTDEVSKLLHTCHAPSMAQNAFAGVDRARRHSDHALRGGAVAREFDGAASARGARDIAPAQVPLCDGKHLRTSGANAHASFAAPFRVSIMASRLPVARISFRAARADILWRCAHRVEPIRAHRRAVSGLNTPKQTGPFELHLVCCQILARCNRALPTARERPAVSARLLRRRDLVRFRSAFRTTCPHNDTVHHPGIMRVCRAKTTRPALLLPKGAELPAAAGDRDCGCELGWKAAAASCAL